MNFRCFLAVCCSMMCCAAQSYAQASSDVENLTSVSSAAIHNGFGFNMTDLRAEWQFKLAADGGATEARFQPGWGSVENMQGQLSMPASDAQALQWCAKYGIKPLLVAGYGPPFRSIGNFTVAADCPRGSTAIALKESVTNVVFPYCHVIASKNQQIVPEGKWAYYGALIAAADPNTNTITLAAATSVDLKAGQTLVINKLLYPSCSSTSPTDPSVLAYARYATFLAQQIAAAGVSGRVELWNEPGWAHDGWDHRGVFYDKPPADLKTESPNFGFAEALANASLPAGARFNWGGTNKSGGRSLLSAHMVPPLTARQVADSLACEAIHPYGNAPEDHGWFPLKLQAASAHEIFATALPATNTGSNMKMARWFNLQHPELGFQQNITETGTITADNVRKARFAMRQYLMYMASGLERVTFYCFAVPHAADSATFGFVDSTTKKPTEAYTAMKDFVVDDMAELPAPPLDYDPAKLPTVVSYHGVYPLTMMQVVGRRAVGDRANTVDLIAWQRSCTPPGPTANLAAASESGAVQLTWSPNPYAQSSIVERAEKSGGPYAPIASNLTRGRYIDKSATSGATYFYVVVESNLAGQSSVSNEVSVTPGDSGAAINNEVRRAGADQASWLTAPSPPAAQVTVDLPDGYTATKAWNLVNRAAVPIATSGRQVTYAVNDDPIALQLVPAPGK